MIYNNLRLSDQNGKSNPLGLSVKFTTACCMLVAFLLLNVTAVFSQASIVDNSISISKLSYSAGPGNNRLIVVAVEARQGGGIDATSITWGGQALTQAHQQTSANGNLQVEIWYLNEAGITVATAGAVWCHDFVVTWDAAPINERFVAFTLKDVNQASPVGDFDGANNASATTIALPAVTVAANDFVCYAAGRNANITHTPPVGYTEITEQNGANPTMGVAVRQITTAGTENPTATFSGGAGQVFIVGVVFSGLTAIGPTTYYSLASGAWNLNTTWSLSADGSSGAVPVGIWPTRADNVVIRAGHNVTIDATDDNKSCGVSPDGLGLPNVGPFAASNLPMFFQEGDIVITGTLTVSGIEMMTDGYVKIEAGAVFSLTSSYVNLGFLEADAGSTLSSADDLILAGNSTTTINTNSVSNDDLIISFTDALLCGSGTTTLQNGSGSVITFANGATVNQVCTTFTIDCIGVGCSGFPVVGTGPPPFGNMGPGGVSYTNGASELVLWLDGNSGVSTSGTSVTEWADQSGYINNAVPPVAANQPTLNTSALNGNATITFDGTDDVLNVSDNSSIDLTTWSFFIVTKVNLHKNFNAFFTKGNDATENFEFLSNFPGVGDIHFPIFYTNATRSGDFETAGGSMSDVNFGIFQYDYDNVNLQLFKDMNQIFTRAETRIPQVNALDLLIGNEAMTTGRNLNGDIAEFFTYNLAVNDAQSIIINNYLSAKYNIALGVNDLYTMDDVGNGNFDFEVAGIGQAADGSSHRDAIGTGVVRIWNPSDLDNNEFLIFGHDNTNLVSSNVVDVGAPVQERLSRVWRVSQTGRIGSVSLSFDINALANPLGSNLRLLIDRDGDGFADNDVPPLQGSFVGNTIVFSGVNFANGDRFTLGNTDLTNPLPVELTSFTARPFGQVVQLDWKTASEVNNDFFAIERSQNAEVWNTLTTVNGSGTTSQAIQYQFLDTQPLNGISFYRLRQTDFDGQYAHSTIQRVEFKGLRNVVAFPNPSSGIFHLSGIDDDHFTFMVFNNLGQLIERGTVLGSDNAIDLSDAPAGIYILRVSNGGTVSSLRIIKQ